MVSPFALAVAADAGALQGSCRAAGTGAGWEPAQDELRLQGLRLQAPCVDGPGPAGVQLLVLDATRASQVLRGPLAEGEPVDLGPGDLLQTASPASQDLSPDVAFNRAWLERILLRHDAAPAGAVLRTRAAGHPRDLATR